MASVVLVSALLVFSAGCGSKEPVLDSGEQTSNEETTQEPVDDGRFIDVFEEVVPSSANEKAVAAQAASYYDAWTAYRRRINPDVELPSIEDLGGNTPKFIGYKIDVYSGKDADGQCGQFSLIVSGDQMNIASEIGWADPVDLGDPSTLDYYSSRTPLDTWDVDPHHVPQSAGEKAAVAKVQAFVKTLPEELLFTPDRVRLGGYTLFWGESPSSEAFVIMSVQPGKNDHYASTNYGLPN